MERMGSGLGWWTRRGLLGLLVALAFAACGDNGVGPDEDPPGVQPLVGVWRATALVVTSVAVPTISPDIIELGASFTLTIERSGSYTAVLLFDQQSSTEIGRLTVSGNTVTMNRQFPSPSTTTATFVQNGDFMTLDGNTEFDFNLDGTPEPAVAHFELQRD